jgi:hypothetical protein
LPPALQIIEHLAGVVGTGGGGDFYLGGEARRSGGKMAGISSAVL